jgi:nucleotide-binding universal stress UspA family protein
MFTSIVVAIDPLGSGDRALPVAAALARRAGVELQIALVSGAGLDAGPDVWELGRRARGQGIDRWTPVMLNAEDPGRALTSYVAERPGALLVMATNAKTPVSQLLLGSVSEAVLAHHSSPVLLVGRHVPASWSLGDATLVAGVDSSELAEILVPAISAWTESFSAASPWLVQVLPKNAPVFAGDVRPSNHVHAVATRMAGKGITAEFEAVPGDPVHALVDFARSIGASALATASTAWVGEHIHWRSTTRNLVRHAPLPVLVVPAFSAD